MDAEENTEQVAEQENEPDALAQAEGRIDNLIERVNAMAETQSGSEEQQSRVQSLTDKISALEDTISRMVKAGAYSPQPQTQAEGGEGEKPAVNSYTPQADVEIFDSMRDMDFNLTDEELNS